MADTRDTQEKAEGKCKADVFYDNKRMAEKKISDLTAAARNTLILEHRPKCGGRHWLAAIHEDGKIHAPTCDKGWTREEFLLVCRWGIDQLTVGEGGRVSKAFNCVGCDIMFTVSSQDIPNNGRIWHVVCPVCQAPFPIKEVE